MNINMYMKSARDTLSLRGSGCRVRVMNKA
jgi:hypothetical protein